MQAYVLFFSNDYTAAADPDKFFSTSRLRIIRDLERRERVKKENRQIYVIQVFLVSFSTIREILISRRCERMSTRT